MRGFCGISVRKIYVNDILRKIPKVDELLARPSFTGVGGLLLLQAIRAELAALRGEILCGSVTAIPAPEALNERILLRLEAMKRPNLGRVINGTGIILHTNLGRAPLAREALEAITDAARGYSNLEYDIENAARGSRHAHVADLLTQLTGAEAAMVVNNNAAAVLLALSALAHNRDVVISRGELVEIGGSFRIPDVMAQSGCRLVEVGTTNKTHLRDYEAALTAAAALCPPGAILRVHASNFKMSGFVSRPSLEALRELAIQFGVPLIEDLGSGALLPLQGQPTVAHSVKAGADVVTFSGDKLLGGPQAGILLGRGEMITKMKAHPLARALRIDKLSLAALEATLRLYLDPATATKKIPALGMLCATEEELLAKAERLCASLSTEFHVSVLTLPGQAGGGAMPEESLPSAGIAITHPRKTAQDIAGLFREGSVPIVGRISGERFLLDVRTIDEGDFPYIARRLGATE